MPDDTALAIGGNALAHAGYAVVGSNNCPCCDICPIWYKLVRCGQGDGCNDNPQGSSAAANAVARSSLYQNEA